MASLKLTTKKAVEDAELTGEGNLLFRRATRIMRLDTRPGDRAEMAIIELVEAGGSSE